MGHMKTPGEIKVMGLVNLGFLESTHAFSSTVGFKLPAGSVHSCINQRRGRPINASERPAFNVQRSIFKVKVSPAASSVKFHMTFWPCRKSKKAKNSKKGKKIKCHPIR